MQVAKRVATKDVRAGLYLAALPAYRQACMEILERTYPGKMQIYVSDSLLDSSVKTGIRLPGIKYTKMHRMLGNRIYVTTGHLREALSMDVLVVDLNPRSLTAWSMLVVRRALNRRTLVWGHLHPRAGATARTVPIRKLMRRLASGTITYTNTDRRDAREAIPGQPVWSATNALYRSEEIQPAYTPNESQRNEVLYVGRFEPAKKVNLLIQAFAQIHDSCPDLRLTLVGGGSQEDQLKSTAELAGVTEKVHFVGWVDGAKNLQAYYERAICSVSPGFAGLALTQSLGFGVPMVVAQDEPHAPEIELAEEGGVIWFQSNSAKSLGQAILSVWNERYALPRTDISRRVRNLYSAERMSDGLRSALMDIR